MKVTSIVPIAILGAGVTLAVPAALEHDPSSGLVLDDRQTPCVAENGCGGIYTGAPGPSSPGLYPIPKPWPCTPGNYYQCVSREARTLIAVASHEYPKPLDAEPTTGRIDFYGPKAADHAVASPEFPKPAHPDPTPGQIDFYGPKVMGRQATGLEPQVPEGAGGFVGLKKARVGPKLENRVPEATPAPGAQLDERETPCVAENDCGGINTQSPAASTSSTTTPAATTLAPTTSVTADTTTLAYGLTPYGGTDDPLVATVTTLTPSEDCYEAPDGQIQCVPISAAGKHIPILPRATPAAFVN